MDACERHHLLAKGAQKNPEHCDNDNQIEKTMSDHGIHPPKFPTLADTESVRRHISISGKADLMQSCVSASRE